MIYKSLRLLVSFLCRIYFRKIYLTGLENLPKDGPIFLTSNHPDGFTEPLLLACFLPRELHFLVRGDVFENPVLKPLLVSTNQIPIYRTKDGFSNLRNNSKTFNVVSRVLNDGQAILVFAEGSTKLSKRVRRIQKGTAKMAYRSLHKNPELDLKIVPVCLYYTEQITFRSEVIIAIGPPISAKKYLSQQDVDEIQGINDLTLEIESSMKRLIPDLDDAEITEVEKFSPRAYDYMTYNAFSVLEKSAQRIDAENELIKNVRKGYAKEPDKRRIIYPDIWSVILFLPATLGFIFHIVPGLITKWTAVWLVNSKVFTNAIRMVVGMVVFLVYYVIWIALMWTYGLSYHIIWIIGMVTGVVFLYYDSHNFKTYLSRIN